MQSIIKEFKSHEEIENEFIMTKLKSKLKVNNVIINRFNLIDFSLHIIL